jgi:hypothetical protein
VHKLLCHVEVQEVCLVIIGGDTIVGMKVI